MIETRSGIRRAVLCGLAAVSLACFVSACAASKTSESTGGYIDDTVITARVKTAIAGDPQLRNPIQTPLQIRVETYKGVVQLSGFVNSPETSQRAALDASKVPGVLQVVNNLIIKTGLPGSQS